MIQAECHAADNARTIEFDATPWFEEADIESIARLAGGGWSSQAVADALSVRPGYERVRDVIRLREIVLEPSPERIHYGRLSRVA